MHRATCLSTLAVALVAATDAASFDLATSLSTKTSYWDQSTDPLKDPAQTKHISPEDEAKYTLVQVQNVVRHGTRYPTKGNTVEIEEFLAKLQTSYPNEIPSWLKTYKLPYNVSVEGLLASAGTKETQEFGSRARKSIGDAVPASYSPDKFTVEHTYKPRTKDTAKGFLSTFFTNPEEVKMIEHSKTSDRLFRFFDECPRYTRDVAENPNATEQVKLYKNSDAFQKNIETLKSKLNLSADANITALDVESAFSACAFDLALYGIEDNWCTLLTEDFIKSSEYAEDLDVFVENSAGAKISYEISAVLLRDIYQTFKAFTQNQSTIVGHFRFAHAETVLPLMTLLGYIDKTPLSGSASAQEIDDRKFRGSRFSPFMANLEFRLYTKNKKSKCTTFQDDCDSDDDSDDDKAKSPKYYVQIRVNEQVTAVPGCDGEVFCKLKKVEKIWDYYLNGYDFDKDCQV